MPETTSSGGPPAMPSSAKRTQSTGVPPTAKAVRPPGISTSSTVTGPPSVIEREAPVWFVAGATTSTSKAGASAACERFDAGRVDAVVVGDQDSHRPRQDRVRA